MKKCPNCGAQMADNIRFCTECGNEFPQGDVCPHCGTSVNEGDNFCQSCGKNLKVPMNENAVSYEEEEEEPKKGFKKYLPYIIGAFLLLLIIGYFSSNGSKRNKESLTNVIDSVVVDSVVVPDNYTSKEYIEKQLDDVFKEALKNPRDYDERFFSSEFKKLYNEVEDIDRETGAEIGFWNFGFWDAAQDGSLVKITVKDVFDVNDTEAKAKVGFKLSFGDGVYNEYNDTVTVVYENDSWMLDDLHGYKASMKDYIRESKNFQPSSVDDNSSYDSNTSSQSLTFANEQYVTMHLANKTFKNNTGIDIRIDGSLRMYIDGDYAGVVSVQRYSSTSALIRYGGGAYGEGYMMVNIENGKLKISDTTDGTTWYQK